MDEETQEYYEIQSPGFWEQLDIEAENNHEE